MSLRVKTQKLRTQSGVWETLRKPSDSGASGGPFPLQLLPLAPALSSSRRAGSPRWPWALELSPPCRRGACTYVSTVTCTPTWPPSLSPLYLWRVPTPTCLTMLSFEVPVGVGEALEPSTWTPPHSPQGAGGVSRHPRSGKRGLRVQKAEVGLTLNWFFLPRREGAWGLSEYLGEDTEFL